MIKPFDSGWSYILDLSFKLISLLVIWSYNCNNAAKKNITHLGTSIVRVCQSKLNFCPQWISKPRIRKPNNHRKLSSSAGRFAQNLRTFKKSHYNIHDCKSGRHNLRHSYKRHRSRYFGAHVWNDYSYTPTKDNESGSSHTFTSDDNIFKLTKTKHNGRSKTRLVSEVPTSVKWDFYIGERQK